MTDPERPAGPAGADPPPAPATGTPQSTPADALPTVPAAPEPRWQPFADEPPVPHVAASPATPTDQDAATSATASAMSDEDDLVSAPAEDTDTLAPDQHFDAPEYVPSAMGMSTASILPPVDTSELPSSAWITSAPQAPARAAGRSGASNLVLTIVGVVVVLAAGLLIGNFLPSDKGKVLFGTAPGSDLCHVGNQTDTVKTNDDLYFAAVLKDHMDGDQAITLQITKDGQSFVNYDEPADGTAFDCYGNRESLAPFEAGAYHFEVVNNGKVEAAGDLTVTAQ